jgi:hypothetical protein
MYLIYELEGTIVTQVSWRMRSQYHVRNATTWTVFCAIAPNVYLIDSMEYDVAAVKAERDTRCHHRDSNVAYSISSTRIYSWGRIRVKSWYKFHVFFINHIFKVWNTGTDRQTVDQQTCGPWDIMALFGEFTCRRLDSWRAFGVVDRSLVDVGSHLEFKVFCIKLQAKE